MMPAATSHMRIAEDVDRARRRLQRSLQVGDRTRVRDDACPWGGDATLPCTTNAVVSGWLASASRCVSASVTNNTGEPA